jgi:hypothetical protein
MGATDMNLTRQWGEISCDLLKAFHVYANGNVKYSILLAAALPLILIS